MPPERQPLSTDDLAALVEAAESVRAHAYAPFSGFHVGAAVLSKDGRVFRGTNVENSSYGLTICAERVAICTAVAAGARGFAAIAIVTDGGHSPCGACRQFLNEWGDELEIVLADATGEREPRRTTLRDLLPDGFRFGPGGP